MAKIKIQPAIAARIILATVLRGIRKNQGQNQSQIAAKLGMQQSGWSRIERGDSAPTVSQMGKIARALNTTVPIIMGKADQIRDVAEKRGVVVLDGPIPESSTSPASGKDLDIINDPATLESILIGGHVATEPSLLPNQSNRLQKQGWLHLEKTDVRVLKTILMGLGEVTYVLDVMVKPGKALVTSSKALGFHTDHHRADYVVWHCLEAAKIGGESILVDAEAAFSMLDEKDQKQLPKIKHYEHKVFDGDEGSQPLLSMQNGKRKFYYTPWLAAKNDKPQPQQGVKEKMPPPQKRAYEAFENAIKKTPNMEIKLQRSEVLIVDNGRILHGRRAFQGGRRHLKRYWIQSSH